MLIFFLHLQSLNILGLNLYFTFSDLSILSLGLMGSVYECVFERVCVYVCFIGISIRHISDSDSLLPSICLRPNTH